MPWRQHKSFGQRHRGGARRLGSLILIAAVPVQPETARLDAFLAWARAVRRASISGPVFTYASPCIPCSLIFEGACFAGEGTVTGAAGPEQGRVGTSGDLWLI